MLKKVIKPVLAASVATLLLAMSTPTQSRAAEEDRHGEFNNTPVGWEARQDRARARREGTRQAYDHDEGRKYRRNQKAERRERRAKERVKERARYQRRRADRHREWRQDGWNRGWDRRDRRAKYHAKDRAKDRAKYKHRHVERHRDWRQSAWRRGGGHQGYRYGMRRQRPQSGFYWFPRRY